MNFEIVIINNMYMYNYMVSKTKNHLDFYIANLRCTYGAIFFKAIMLWLVVGKITTITLQMKKTFEFPMAASHATITVLMPWCLLVAGLSALMTSYSTMTFLVYLAQDKTPQHRYMKTNSHQQILAEDQEPCCSNNNHHSIPMTRLK